MLYLKPGDLIQEKRTYIVDGKSFDDYDDAMRIAVRESLKNYFKEVEAYNPPGTTHMSGTFKVPAFSFGTLDDFLFFLNNNMPAIIEYWDKVKCPVI